MTKPTISHLICLYVHSGEIAGVSGGIDFEHAKSANGGENGEKPPIVIASSGSVFHWGSGSWRPRNWPGAARRFLRFDGDDGSDDGGAAGGSRPVFIGSDGARRSL